MKTNRIAKIFTLVMVMITTMSLSALAGQSKTYYAKAIATSTGEGKVYVDETTTPPPADAYQETSERVSSGTTTDNRINVVFYLFGKANTPAMKLEGWYDNADCTGNALSSDNPYRVSIQTNSQDESAPATKNYYAKFVEATEFYSSTMTINVVGEGGTATVSTDAQTEGTGQTASVLHNVETKHNYYLKAEVEDAHDYRFLGWYSDEECTNRISTSTNYTYTVTSDSQDDANPTQAVVYAKFEAIPYYYSAVYAYADGDGKVFVSTANSTEGAEFGLDSESHMELADNATHTYYLFAQTNDPLRAEFDGWYSDEECTELISRSLNYTYKVTAESMDPDAETEFMAYAKFTSRNMYQVRNAGFEKWAASNEVGYGWNSFQSATGSQASLGKGMSPNPEKVEGRDGGSAVRIFSKYAGFMGIGANANGNLTTGTVNMGSMTPTDASNHNYSNVEDPDHSLLIEGQPDAVEFYTKYKMGDGEPHTGHAQFIIHDEYNYRDPEVDEELEHKIAECGVNIEESEDWVLNTVDMSYIWTKEDADAAKKYLLINFTTNVTPGGSKNDTLVIDDVRLIYYSELATAKIGESDVVFTDGAATIDGFYDADALVLTSNGRAATIERSYNVTTGLLTITVKGQDYTEDNNNAHVYTIQYNPVKYTLTFVVDEQTVKTEQLAEGEDITAPEMDPRTGYTFAWTDEIPETMPASDLTINGAYTVNSYKLTFVVDGETIKTEDVDFGATITAPEMDPREGYTFAWTDEVPETMPAHDVTINGAYTVNTYKVTYLRADGETTVATFEVNYGEAMPEAPKYVLNEDEKAQNLIFDEWEGETYETMPAKDVTYTAKLKDDPTTGISVVEAMKNTLIYNLQGQRVESVRRGQVYIINGKKYIVK